MYSVFSNRGLNRYCHSATLHVVSTSAKSPQNHRDVSLRGVSNV